MIQPSDLIRERKKGKRNIYIYLFYFFFVFVEEDSFVSLEPRVKTKVRPGLVLQHYGKTKM
jgi:hypothetical protein